MKNLIVILAMVFSTFALSAQTTITQWVFDGSTSTDIPGGVGNPIASTGTGTLTTIGGITATFGNGSGSTDPISPTSSNFSWQTTGYPTASTASSSAGIVIATSTAGFHALSLTFDQRLSSTSNNTWIIYYTNDITATTPVWTQATVFTFTPTTTSGDTWYNQRTADLSSFTSLNDNANFGIKIVSAFDPTAGNYLAAASNKTYATTGNARFDMITIAGIADVITVNLGPQIQSAAVTGSLNVGDTLHASYIYTDPEGDLEGSSQYAWYRADDAAGTNADSLKMIGTKDYILTDDDLNKFISFEIIPFAKTGTTVGLPFFTPYQGPINESQEILFYPEPYDLPKGNYALKNWAATSVAGTFPMNMVFQQFNNEPSSSGFVPTALWECSYNSSSHSRILGLDDAGFAFINTSDEQSTADCANGTNTGGYVGAAVLALNTTGLSNITISWSASLVVAANGSPARVYNLQPQYRIAGTNVWTELGATFEFTSANATIGNITTYSAVLPVAVENVPDVFIRWIYYQFAVGGSGSRPEISLDDILVTVPGAPNAAPTVSNLVVDGLPLLNQTLSASYAYADVEGDLQGQSSFQWYRADDISGTNTVTIAGAVNSNYLTSADDAGKYIAFAIIPVAKTGTLSGTSITSVFVGPIYSLGDPSVLKINEVYSTGDQDPAVKEDWIEFYNPGTQDVSVAGLKICDSGSCEIFPNAYSALTVPAGGFLALLKDNPNSFTFGLSSAGEYVVLKNPFTNKVIDSLNFPATVVGQSYGRYKDGATRETILIPPTFDASNNTSSPQDVTTGLQERNLITSVYPNPTKDNFIVEGSIDNPIQIISVSNLAGQEMMRVTPISATTQLPFNDIKSGFYILSLTHQDGMKEIRKIVKE